MFLVPRVVVLLLICHAGATGAEYPTKPLRFIVGPAPLSGTDTVARIVAQRLSDRLGQSVIVDNRPGAGGNIAASIAAKATPDGYVLLFASASHAINAALYRKLSFDPLRDFVPVTLVGVVPQILIVNPAVPAQNARELIALARDKPGLVSYGSGGVGTTGHLAGELFQMLTRARIHHVPYKGNGPAVVDVIAGQIQIAFVSTVNALGHIRTSRVRGLAVTTANRSAATPGIPTLAESGVPGYEMSSWYGVLAPRGVPLVIVDRLNRDIGAVLKLPEVEGKLAADGAEPAPGTPRQFGAFLNTEIERITRIVREAGIVVD
jgi:tripartite-type tricarboxylate transporter receptor subunit TctC